MSLEKQALVAYERFKKEKTLKNLTECTLIMGQLHSQNLNTIKELNASVDDTLNRIEQAKERGIEEVIEIWEEQLEYSEGLLEESYADLENTKSMLLILERIRNIGNAEFMDTNQEDNDV